ncbi:MAG: hypothetical protein PHG08_00355 [Bacilli bacterium]|nr:hypothetical protein [Bacilli bacterium]
MEYIKIKDEPLLIKDVNSGAVINTDKTGYNKYIEMRRKKELESNRMENLENELADIKLLLQELLKKI